MKKNLGISLVTLVITIIVMIILAGIIVVSVSESNIFDKAKTAVDLTDKKQIEQLVTTAWAEAYLDGARSQADLQTAVNEVLKEYKIDDKYTSIATEKGIMGVYVPVYDNEIAEYTKSAYEGGSAEDYLALTGKYPVILKWDTADGVLLKEARIYIKDLSYEDAEFKLANVSMYPKNEVMNVIGGGSVTASAFTNVDVHGIFNYEKVMLKVVYILEDGTYRYNYSHEIDLSNIPQ